MQKLFAFAAAATLILTAPATAQQLAPGPAIWADAGCTGCHGGIGRGGGGGENPAGPNIWRSKLDREQFKEVVSCGREKTGMPGFAADAFTKRACWGRPVGPAPAEATIA